MRAVVDPAQALAVDVAVDLRRRERAVAEQLLDHAQVGAALEQVRRERVAQPVRVRADRAAACSCRAAARARRGRARPRRRARAAGARRGGSSASQYAASSPSGTTRSLSPLPCTRTCSCSKSTSARSRPHRLGAAQARRVDELEQRAVAERERPVALERLEQRFDVLRSPARSAAGARAAARRPSGTRDGPSAKRRNERTAASLRAIVAGASLRRSRPELRRVVGERACVDVVERGPRLLEPRRERLEVEAVRSGGSPRTGPAKPGSARRHPRLVVRRPVRSPPRGGRTTPRPSRQAGRGYGANVQPGQVVNVNAEHGQDELARAVAAHAYRRGARFVDVGYFDPYVKRARIEHADAETLDFVPPWYGKRALDRRRAARRADLDRRHRLRPDS